MKKLLFVLALTLTFASCQKENIQPNPVEVVEIEESGIDLYGEWVLLDGQMFIENMETGAIEASVTTWEFVGTEFILDNDSIQPYGLSVNNIGWSIVEHPTATAATMQLGGSSRPLSAVVESYGDNIVVFTVQEGYASIDGYNCTYYSELRFQKQ